MNAFLSNSDTESTVVIDLAAPPPSLNEPLTFTWGTQTIQLTVAGNQLGNVVNDPTFAQYIKDNDGNNLTWSLAEAP